MDKGSSEKATTDVAQQNSMAKTEIWRISRPVDVRRDGAVQVIPHDHDTQREAALVDTWKAVRMGGRRSKAKHQRTFDIIARPCQCVSEARIDSHGSQENTGVFCSRGICAQQQRKSSGGNQSHGDIANASGARAIAYVSSEDRRECGNKVRRHGE